MAAIPDQEFEEIVTDWRGTIERENERVTVNLFNAANKPRGTLETGENISKFVLVLANG